MKRPVRRKPRKNKLKLPLVLASLLLIAGGLWLVWHQVYGSPKYGSKSPTYSDKTGSSHPTPPSPGFNKQMHSINEASSLWVVVNKGRVLPSSYVPANLITPNVPLRLSAGNSEMKLRSDTAAATEKLVSDAKKDNVNLMLASGYRSYALQVLVYDSEVSTGGQAQADSVSARPGHSEHQTGLAADLEPASRSCELEACFADTPEGKWLATNAHRYGFIIRYQKGKEGLTGYSYEPWHLRYVGKELSTEIYNSGSTLEQFFGSSSYTSYPQNSYSLKS